MKGTLLVVTVEIYLDGYPDEADKAHYAKKVYQALRREYEQVGISNDNNGVVSVDISCGSEMFTIGGTE